MARKGRQISAGGVLYRMGADGPEVALISLKEGRVWALPKGIMDKGEEPEEAALREVREETGMEGGIVAPLGYIKYFFYSRDDDTRYFKLVHFFLMRYLSGSEEDHDWEVEAVQWFPLPEAMKLASYKTERDILKKAGELLAPLGRN